MVARNDPFWTIKDLNAAKGGRYEHFILPVAFQTEYSLKCKNDDYDDESSDLSPDRVANNFFFRDVKLREDLPDKNIARITKAAKHKLSGKSSLNVSFVLSCPDHYDHHFYHDHHDQHDHQDYGGSRPGSTLPVSTFSSKEKTFFFFKYFSLYVF